MIPPLPHDPSPWWRHRMMWLVIGGPLAVIVAGLVTIVIAVRGADELVPGSDAQATRGAAPAVQGRNQAATPAPGIKP